MRRFFNFDIIFWFIVYYFCVDFKFRFFSNYIGIFEVDIVVVRLCLMLWGVNMLFGLRNIYERMVLEFFIEYIFFYGLLYWIYYFGYGMEYRVKISIDRILE